MIERVAVVQEARSWISTRYAHQQRMKGVAVDCAGLIIGVARDLAILPPDFVDPNDYSRQPDGVTLLALSDRWMARIPFAQMAWGDVVVMTFEVDPCHFAILGDYPHGGLSVIHALCRRDGRGSVVEHRLDTRLARLVAAYRLPGVA